MEPKSYASADILRRLEQGDAPVRIELPQGATAWNPASDKRPIYGPCTVLYRQWPDGGIEATVEQPEGHA